MERYKIKTALKYIRHDRAFFTARIIMLFFKWLPDTVYLKFLYRAYMAHNLNLKNPKTFTEKIQWLKLYDRKPEYTTMVDKYAVKDYVAKIIGEEYIIPTIGVWDKIEDINWDCLPTQFVLKTCHGGGSGGVVICNDITAFDRNKAIKKLEKSLSTDIYSNYREWPYKNVPKRIIAEKFMADYTSFPSSDLIDYKFYCFNGEPVYCQVIRDRNSKETIDFYDMDWNHMEFIGLNPSVSNGLNSCIRPHNIDCMKGICRKLSKDIPFVRIDLYEIDNKVYFGEFTFYPASGLGVFSPEEWNLKLGNIVRLPFNP